MLRPGGTRGSLEGLGFKDGPRNRACALEAARTRARVDLCALIRTFRAVGDEDFLA